MKTALMADNRGPGYIIPGILSQKGSLQYGIIQKSSTDMLNLSLFCATKISILQSESKQHIIDVYNQLSFYTRYFKCLKLHAIRTAIHF